MKRSASQRVGAGALVFDFELVAGGSKLMRAIGAAVVGEQGAYHG